MATRDMPAGIAVAATLTLFAPLIVGGVLVFTASSESPLESASKIKPLVGVVERAERYSDATVAIAVEHADAQSPATHASGTITGLGIRAGSEVANAHVIMDVDAKQVIAYASASPLYRDITREFKGGDVRVVQQLLKDLRFFDGNVDGKVGYATGNAIKAFNRKYGYGDDNGILSLTSLVWTGPSAVTVDKMSVALGDSVSPGAAMFSITADLAAINVTETPNVPRDAKVQLVVNDISTPYEPGAGRITEPDAVAKIAKSLGTASEGVGTVRLVAPRIVGTIPSSAVVADEAGRSCIFADATSGPTVVKPLGGSLGTVDLDASLVGVPVLVNPRDMRENLSCG